MYGTAYPIFFVLLGKGFGAVPCYMGRPSLFGLKRLVDCLNQFSRRMPVGLQERTAPAHLFVGKMGLYTNAIFA